MGTRELAIPLRTYHLEPQQGLPCHEVHFHYLERTVSIPARETALVLVDVWARHYVDSYLARAEEIVRTRIVPAVVAARRAGVSVVHAPGLNAARNYPQWTRDYGDNELSPPVPSADWPPPEFRRREGPYAQYRRPQGPVLTKAIEEVREMGRRIDPSVEPQPDDFIVFRGDELHRLCKHHRIVHLFYAGFAANMCLQFKDYGVRAFRARGYHLIVLRDCTTAVESHDTVADLTGTRQAIRELEMEDLAATTTSNAFIRACERAAGGA
jgi:nicotinamidase-related amidase